MKIISKLIVLFVVGSLVLVAPRASAFNFFRDSCTGEAAKSAACQDNNGNADTASNNVVLRTISTAANLVAVVTGVVAVAMIVVGGLSYVTSAGNAEKAATARRRILYSVMGLVVVALAWVIIRFVTDKVLQ